MAGGAAEPGGQCGPRARDRRGTLKRGIDPHRRRAAREWRRGREDALWVLSASQAARLMEVPGAVENPRAVPAQRSVERANTPLLPAADTAGAVAETASAPAAPGGTEQANAGGGGNCAVLLSATGSLGRPWWPSESPFR